MAGNALSSFHLNIGLSDQNKLLAIYYYLLFSKNYAIESYMSLLMSLTMSNQVYFV